MTTFCQYSCNTKIVVTVLKNLAFCLQKYTIFLIANIVYKEQIEYNIAIRRLGVSQTIELFYLGGLLCHT